MRNSPPREAPTAAEGLRLAKESRPDLILLDVDLPDMDGREALKLMRSGGVSRAGGHADRPRPATRTPSWAWTPAPTTM